MGPATSTADKVRELVEGGMDVARLNFSHGSHADHKQIYDIVRAASDESGRAVGILADLQGPKIRLGTFAAGPVEWSTGDTVRITVEDIEGTHDRVATTYKGLARDARVGDRMLVDDGKIALRVKEVQGSDVVAEVTEGGTVSNHKGLSLPGMDVSVPALSEKDIEDLEFALQLGTLPSSIDRLVFTAAIDGPGSMREIQASSFSIKDAAGQVVATCSFSGSTFAGEKAIMLADIYRKDEQWRLASNLQGFNDGLAALVKHFGGEVSDPAPAPAPSARR